MSAGNVHQQGKTYGEIKLERAREDVRIILADRWGLGDGDYEWEEYDEQTLDEIVNAFRPLFLDAKIGLR